MVKSRASPGRLAWSMRPCTNGESGMNGSPMAACSSVWMRCWSSACNLYALDGQRKRQKQQQQQQRRRRQQRRRQQHEASDDARIHSSLSGRQAGRRTCCSKSFNGDAPTPANEGIGMGACRRKKKKKEKPLSPNPRKTRHARHGSAATRNLPAQRRCLLRWSQRARPPLLGDEHCAAANDAVMVRHTLLLRAGRASSAGRRRTRDAAAARTTSPP